mgnify:CR=1 FL=1
MKLSVYRNSNDTKGVIASLEAVIDRIRSGANGLDEKTRYCNATATTDPKAYKAYKETNLPAVTFSGTFSKRGARYLTQHSGWITIDIDGLTAEQSAYLLAELAQHPYIRLAFVSPSGLGIKVIVRVDPIPTNDLEHKGAYQACLDLFDDLATEYGFEIDTTGKDCSRLCYLAHDPLAIVHPDVPAIEWDRDAWIAAEKAKQARFEADARKAYTGEADVKALDFIDPNDLDYNQWLSVLTACKQAGLSLAQADAWSRRGGVRYIEGEVENRWQGLHLNVSWGAVVNLAKTNGYKPPRSSIRRPVKLHKNVVSMLTETLDASREFLQSVFENKRIKFFGLRADTGVGKNQKAITFYLKGFSGLVNVPTTDLAKELQARFHKAEIDAFRYRGILSNPDGEFPDENPCFHAVRYDAITSRGWNAFEWLCGPCDVRDICEERGYRSQPEQAKHAQVTVMPFPDIFLNPAFRHIAKDFLPTYSDDLILYDEFDPARFLKIDVPKARLHQLRDDWKGTDPSHFAKELLRILEVEGDLSLLRPLIMGLSDAERDSVIEGFTCVMFEGKILSREDAHRCDDFRMASRSLDTIHTLPRLETETWNLLVQLELFYDRYKRDADMPMKYENDTLTFYLPPLPIKTRARMGFMSATLNETFFRRAMDNREKQHGDLSYHDTGLTEWHKDARVFQLRTNRNPRATAYTPKSERVDGELLSPSGEFYFQLVADDLKNENRGLITYKALLEASPFGEGVRTANFGGLVGLDTHFKDVDVLHILFSPELPLTTVAFKAKMLFGDDTEPLCYDRDADGNYIDARLQACYEDGVISEIIQAFGRGRAVSRPVIIVIWCSHFLPGITDREQTRLFDEIDWQAADGDISKLADVIEAREAAEQNGDAHAYAAATGQSQRTAYRRTVQGRKPRQTERDAELLQRILELRDKDMSDSDIATELGISRGRLQYLMGKHTAA